MDLTKKGGEMGAGYVNLRKKGKRQQRKAEHEQVLYAAPILPIWSEPSAVVTWP